MCLDLNSFWESLASSKNSLEKVEIKSFSVSSSKPKDLNIDMPRLNTRNIRSTGRTYTAYKVIKPWKESPGVRIQKVLLTIDLSQDIDNNKRLIEFFDTITNVLDNLHLTLEVDIRKVSPSVLTISLCNF